MQYIHNWKRNGWVTAQKKPVANREELQELDAALSGLAAVRWKHVRGHSGIRGNEEADRLANDAALRFTGGNS